MDECKLPLLDAESSNSNPGNVVVLDIRESCYSAENCTQQHPNHVFQNGHRNGVWNDYQDEEEEEDDEDLGSEAASNPFDFVGLLQNPGCSYVSTVVDPFQNNTPGIVGLYEWIKTMVMIPVALVRLILMGLALAVGYLATRLALEGWTDRHNPMPKWRARLMWITRFCARSILFSFGYHWIRRKGRPAPREVAPIVVANHVSYTDPIFFFYEIFPSFVASESHDTIPFVGTVIRAMQVISVDRTSPTSRKHAISEIKRKASCNDFPRVMLFPEGTTTNGKTLISFRLGAFVHGYPVQPVVVRYPHVHFDQSWGTISVLKLMFRMFTQIHNFMEVDYLPVIYPDLGKKDGAVRLAKQVRIDMSKALNVVQTQYSYGDLMLANRAMEIGLAPVCAYMVEMANLERFLHLSIVEATGFLDRYVALGPDQSGCVNMQSFLVTFGLGTCPLSVQIFNFIDEEKEGKITFKEYLYVSAHLVKHPNFTRMCKSAFLSCDVSRKGFLSKDEVERILRSITPSSTNDDVCRLFKQFDVDNDGKISSCDFMTCLERNPLLIAMWNPEIFLNPS